MAIDVFFTPYKMISFANSSYGHQKGSSMKWLYQFSCHKKSWVILALSAFGLLMAALYFQHALEHRPCIKCIYQRTAVIGILLAAIIPIFYNHWLTRLSAFLIWGYSALQGLLIAREHLEIIFSDDPFFAVCEFVPNFPSYLPVHEWLPTIFGVTGECIDNRWQFLGMGMASWMQIIFSVYLAILVVVVMAQAYPLLKRK
jgi:disulfide bond formation protein DsbB